ncbi:aldehyde ferredoxin oxidoreductase family protein [Solirubrobacter soli]|uniref:aldehyde ferredoxin oxidoreductase family protein n=1 Tax=Solirubrobacter soli TaxID=363832 RepID=UPI0004244BB1|nr:aldehyde ferredoxin oxidoreductase C-terminal domain-containing protein [Solirubrobacter soli]
MPPGGYFGRALVVDLDDGGSTTLPLSDATLRATLGGVGLGAHLLSGLAPAGVEPLAPAAPIAFVFSPLVGTPLTTSAKFAVVAKSPLTDRLNDALASSHFAIAGKLTGHDAIVIRGARSTPSALIVDGDGPRLVDAAHLWGLTAAEAEERMREELGPAYRIAAIGPAGERLVRYATVSHDGRHAGRGGLGAVLGAKGLKAIAVRATTRCPVADPAAVLAAAKDLRARSFGPATAKYRDLGTLSNLLTFNALSALPGQNFGTETTTLALEDRAAVRDSCASCSIGCERIMTLKDGRSARVEYESAFALGPLVGIDDPDDVLQASARCDELGLDTISTGGTIAWAMEAGVADWLRFGDADALLRAIELIGAREGVGDLLAEGSRRASARFGREDLAMHVKGLELPGYEPRTLHAMALGLSVNARGADHNRSGAYEADLSGDLNRLDGGMAHVAAAIETEDRAAAMDSLILCKFLRGVFADPWTEWAALLAAVTGWDIDADELHDTARGIVAAKHAFNRREGWTRAEDTLPGRLLDVPLTLPSGREAALSRERLEAMVDAYHRTRGLDLSVRERDPAEQLWP